MASYWFSCVLMVAAASAAPLAQFNPYQNYQRPPYNQYPNNFQRPPVGGGFNNFGGGTLTPQASAPQAPLGGGLAGAPLAGAPLAGGILGGGVRPGLPLAGALQQAGLAGLPGLPGTNNVGGAGALSQGQANGGLYANTFGQTQSIDLGNLGEINFSTNTAVAVGNPLAAGPGSASATGGGGGTTGVNGGSNAVATAEADKGVAFGTGIGLSIDLPALNIEETYGTGQSFASGK